MSGASIARMDVNVYEPPTTGELLELADCIESVQLDIDVVCPCTYIGTVDKLLKCAGGTNNRGGTYPCASSLKKRNAKNLTNRQCPA